MKNGRVLLLMLMYSSVAGIKEAVVDGWPQSATKEDGTGRIHIIFWPRLINLLRRKYSVHPPSSASYTQSHSVDWSGLVWLGLFCSGRPSILRLC